MAIGYKVVRELPNVVGHIKFADLVSVRSTAMVYYAKNKWTYPEKGCGPLCLFNNFDAAMDFIMKNCKEGEIMSVWESEYLPSKLDYVHTSLPYRVHLLELPPETVLADAIMLRRKSV